MTENLAIRKLDTMQAELGRPGYTLDHRDFNLQPQQTRILQATDESYIILDADDSIVVRSQLGVYDRVTALVAESVHHHTGEITLENHSTTDVEYVEFIVAVWH